MKKCLDLLIVAILLSLVAHRCLAADLLILTFDKPSKPFVDSSPSNLLVTGGTKCDGMNGKGVKWSKATPRSPAGGGYAVFDGGSFLTVEGSESLVLLSDFTIRFWFKSPGIDRGVEAPFGRKYQYRMHPLRLGGDAPNDNLDIDFDDTDGGHGLWTYWLGGGNPFIWTDAGTIWTFTDNRWYHYWLVREKGIMTLYIGDEQRIYTLIGDAKETRKLGSPVAPVQIGRIYPFLSNVNLCWFGALDDIRIVNEALHPTGGCK